VNSPNLYADGKQQVVQIKIMDVLFNEQVCHMVYMQDISSMHKEK